MTSPTEPVPAVGSWKYSYDCSRNFRQQALHVCKAQEILFGGAAGPGKTEALIAAGVAFCLLIPGGKVILFRRTFPQLEMEIIPRMLARLPPHIAKYKSNGHVFEFHNGSTFRLGYLAGAKDHYNYQGVEVQLVLWDELTQFERYQYVYLRSRLRMAGSVADEMRKRNWVPRMISSSNPGGPGHGWVKRMFYDPSPGKDRLFYGGIEPGESKKGLRWMAYLPAKATDNPFLDVEAYLTQLEALDPILRRAYMEGDWDILEGVRFPQFRRAVHVIDPGQLPVPLIGYPRAVGVDYGLQAPFAALWGALLPDNLVVVYRGLHAANLTAEQQAKLIIEAEGPGERIPSRPVPVALDPSCWARTANQIEKSFDPNLPARGSIAWWYRKQLGGAVVKANNDRIPGWHLVDHHLRVREDGLPRILIYSTCLDIIRTLPEQQRSKMNPEDVDTKGDDHDSDALRYLLMQLLGGGHSRTAPDVPDAHEVHDVEQADDWRYDRLLREEHRNRFDASRELNGFAGARRGDTDD